MRKAALIIAIILTLIVPGVNRSDKVNAAWSPLGNAKMPPGLQAKLLVLQPRDQLTAIVTLVDQVDLSAIPAGDRAARQQGVVRALQAHAAASQKQIQAFLNARSAQGKVSQVAPFWVFNGLSVTATPQVFQELAARDDVAKITPDEIQVAPSAPQALSPPQANLSLVQAPDLWDLGVLGQGAVVANLDSGVDLNHPDLVASWRNGSNSWFDPFGEHPITPTDLDGHGTWTMGVMVAGETSGTVIGVAPGAKWIAAKIFNDHGVSTATAIHQSFQWLLDPDGDPGTADAPTVVNNSWTFTAPGCNLEFELDLQALRAVDILPVFAAGNNSVNNYSPANNPSAFAVGATDLSDVIAEFSSQGPSACTDRTAIYPDLVAPGVYIHTTDLLGSYTDVSGTSLAAPHVAGGLALLLSSNPGLSVADQQSTLINTAVDLGLLGPDNVYGNGRLDLLEAYQALNGPVVPPATPNPGDLDVSFGTNGLVYTDIGTSSGDKAYAVALQDDGKIVVAGSSNDGTQDDFAVARYTTTGILDTDFSTDGKLTTPVGSTDDVAYAVAVQSDGKIVVAGSTFNGVDNDFALARYTITGTLDLGFSTDGLVTTAISGDDVARSVAIQTDGKIVVAGYANEDFAIVRFDQDGNLDEANFGSGTGIVTTDFFGALDQAHGLAIQPADGKLVVAGFSDNGDSEEFAVARYLTTGALDTATFGSGTGVATTDFVTNSTDQAYSVALQPDGKIVLAGFINTGAGPTDDFGLARFTTTGELDGSFGTNGRVVTSLTGNDDQAYSIGIQPTGRIVLAGFSDNAATTFQDFSLARYTSTGTLDTSFGLSGIVTTDLGTINNVSATADQAYALAIQPDNKIVVAGFSDYPSGNDNFAIVRYESPNNPPSLSHISKDGLEDTAVTFTQSDFTSGFSDADGDQLVKVRITSLSAYGTLSLSGTPLVVGQEIMAVDLPNLSFTPLQDWNGSTSFSWSGSDGLDYAVIDAAVLISISPVNDPPSFTAGSDVVVLEDAGLQAFTGWAVDISPGPANESDQVMIFTLTTSNDALFAGLPVINATTGNLSFTPAVDLNGSASVTVTLSDNGGTLNGGVDTSALQVFTITVLPVNDAPSFTMGADISVSEDAGPQTVAGWAGDIVAGPLDEAEQGLAFSLTTSNDALFAGLPQLDVASGDLSYTTAPNLNGSATVTVTLQDNGGTVDDGIDTSTPQEFTIKVSPANDAPALSDITDQSITANTSAGPIMFTIGDIDNVVEELIVSGSSSDQTLLPQEAFAFSGFGADRTVVITPARHQAGSATIMITVSDGLAVTSDTFTLTVGGFNLYLPITLRTTP